MRAKIQALPYLILLLPLDIVVAFALLTAQVLYKLRLIGKRKDAIASGKSSTSIRPPITNAATIIIVNWDGKHLLEESLPAVLEAARFEGGNHEVLVVDNGSTDGSPDFVRTRFPQVRVLALDRNHGFTGGNNRGIQET